MNHYYAVPPNVELDDIQFWLDAASPPQEGLLDWNPDDGTLNLGMPGGEVNLQIGQEVLARCRNTSGAQIDNGTAVYVTGATGDRPEIGVADSVLQTGAFGVTTEDIPNGQSGFVNTFGMVRDVNTNAFNEGDYLWLNAAGGITNVRPSSPEAIVFLGVCIRKHLTEGVIFVNTFISPSFSRLSEVREDWHYNQQQDDYDGKFSTVGEVDMLVIDAGGDFIGIGGGTNFIKIAKGGELTLEGTATRFLDERGFLTGARIESPASKVQVDNTESAYTYDDTCTLADYLWTNIQLNHDRLNGVVLDVHLHWWQASANIPNWLVQWRYQQQGAAKDASWSNLAWVSHVFTYTAGTLCQITDFGNITPPVGDDVSDILQIRIIRDTGNASGLFGGADPLVGDAYIYDFDLHKQLDAMGSAQEYIK